MNEVIRFPALKRRVQLIQIGDRDATVTCMAEHLVAAVLTDGLDLENDVDVIATLYHTPERFSASVVALMADFAVVEAKQIIIAKQMGDA